MPIASYTPISHFALIIQPGLASFCIVPPILFISFVHMIEQDCATLLTISAISHILNSIQFYNEYHKIIPVFILYFLFNISQIFGCNITFQILGQLLCCRLQILLIILEYHGLIVLFQIIRKYVCVHESLTTLAEYIDSLFQELHLQILKWIKLIRLGWVNKG